MAKKKDFLDKEDMKKINFSKRTTDQKYADKDFIYDFLSSVRKKINDPLGTKGAIIDTGQ